MKILEKYFNELDKNVGEGTISNKKIMENALGFSIARSRSNVSGTGVFVSSGTVKKGDLVSIYPGMFYIIQHCMIF